MEPDQRYEFEAELWLYSAAKASWHFVTVPEEVSRRIRFMSGNARGFGSIRVSAQIGKTRWVTSLFPDRASGCYFLPVKAAVRRTETVSAGDHVRVNIETG